MKNLLRFVVFVVLLCAIAARPRFFFRRLTRLKLPANVPKKGLDIEAKKDFLTLIAECIYDPTACGAMDSYDRPEETTLPEATTRPEAPTKKQQIHKREGRSVDAKKSNIDALESNGHSAGTAAGADSDQKSPIKYGGKVQLKSKIKLFSFCIDLSKLFNFKSDNVF